LTTERWSARPYERSDKAAWDDLVRRARSPHFFFERDFMEYHSDRFTDASVVVLRNDRIAAVMPANVDGDTVWSHAGLTFGGLLSSDDMTARRVVEAFGATCAHLRTAGATRLVYAPPPHIYHRVPAEEDLYALFRSDARLICRDLASTLRTEAAARPRKSRRASIARAARNGITCGRDVDWHGFMALERELLNERHGVDPVHTGDEIAALADRFPDGIKLYSARLGRELLAGAVIFDTQMVAHAQYLGTSAEGRDAGALDLLLDHLLHHVYGNKPYFDFGISTEDEARRLNIGLARYKESFGARGVVYDRYEVQL
jgi:hypothetical protein